MIGKKTATLVGAAAKVAGLVAGRSEEECGALFEYGYNAGLAYQLYDDMVSVWGKELQTGKREWGDIMEKKKTLPLLHLYSVSKSDTQTRLRHLYTEDHYISSEEAAEIVALLDCADVEAYMQAQVQTYATKAKHATETLSLTKAQKETLSKLVDSLFTL
jgi:geranylgeranyl pyrophosphate synthase